MFECSDYILSYLNICISKKQGIVVRYPLLGDFFQLPHKGVKTNETRDIELVRDKK